MKTARSLVRLLSCISHATRENLSEYNYIDIIPHPSFRRARNTSSHKTIINTRYRGRLELETLIIINNASARFKSHGCKWRCDCIVASLGDQCILVPQPFENTVEAASVIVVDWSEYKQLL